MVVNWQGMHSTRLKLCEQEHTKCLVSFLHNRVCSTQTPMRMTHCVHACSGADGEELCQRCAGLQIQHGVLPAGLFIHGEFLGSGRKLSQPLCCSTDALMLVTAMQPARGAFRSFVAQNINHLLSSIHPRRMACAPSKAERS